MKRCTASVCVVRNGQSQDRYAPAELSCGIESSCNNYLGRDLSWNAYQMKLEINRKRVTDLYVSGKTIGEVASELRMYEEGVRTFLMHRNILRFADFKPVGKSEQVEMEIPISLPLA
jgi:hypothetical protein